MKMKLISTEMASKEFVRAEIAEVRAEIAEVRAEIVEVKTLLKVLIGLALFGLTLANPGFLTLMEKIFG